MNSCTYMYIYICMYVYIYIRMVVITVRDSGPRSEQIWIFCSQEHAQKDRDLARPWEPKRGAVRDGGDGSGERLHERLLIYLILT